ncbi:MAG: response regulator [Cellvibrionaceae bacterium]
MSDKKRVLVVDDSPNEIRILMELLKDDYAVVAATSGEKALEIVNGDSAPDIVLMDVTMEPMDGYEATSKILETHPDLPVIFVSANTQTDEILKGFEVGGSDYITKPVDPEVVSRKVELTLEQSAERNQLEQQKSQANEMVMTALSSAGNLGIVLNFLREGLKVTARKNLADVAISAVKKYNLDACLLLRHTAGNITRSTNTINQLEQELLERAAHMEARIFEKGNRLILNYSDVSMLIKNMPVDNEVLMGELRDHLASIAEDTDILNRKIGGDEAIAEQRSVMVAEILQETQSTLGEIESSQAEQKESSMRIMDSLVEEIEESFLSMGLTEEQEEQILQIVQRKNQIALENFEKGLHMDEQLKRITQQLADLSQSYQ